MRGSKMKSGVSSAEKRGLARKAEKPKVKVEKWKHGTFERYGNMGCRCKRCRHAAAERQRRYRRLRAEKKIEQTGTRLEKVLLAVSRGDFRVGEMLDLRGLTEDDVRLLIEAEFIDDVKPVAASTQPEARPFPAGPPAQA